MESDRRRRAGAGKITSVWPGAPESHADTCPAEKALAVLRAGVDRPAAVRHARLALDNDTCLSHPRCIWHAMTALLCAGELVTVDAQLRRLEILCKEQSDELIAVLRAQHARLVGDLPWAAAEFAWLSSAANTSFVRLLAVPFLLETLAAGGKVAEADELLAEHGYDGPLSDAEPNRPMLLAARGLVHLVAHRFDKAAQDCLECLRFPVGEFAVHFALRHCRGLAAMAIAQAGGDESAAAELAAQELDAALAWGSPADVGWALYVRAVVDGSPATCDLLSDAIDLLEVANSRVLLAAASYELGARSFGTKDYALVRHEFERAARWARQLGNIPFAVRMETALDKVARAERPSSLTSQEAKIAELAQAGYSNKQIAGKLFVTVRTVEFHLSNVYRKLRIGSRRELVEGPKLSR